MFELGGLPEPEEIGTLDDAGLIDAVVVTAALESAARACRLAALDELYLRRTYALGEPPRSAHNAEGGTFATVASSNKKLVSGGDRPSRTGSRCSCMRARIASTTAATSGRRSVSARATSQ